MITIIDYGVGNIRAFENVYKQLNIPITIATTTTALENATRIILPGVGAFDYAMEQLNKSGMRECLNEKVLVQRVPVLGICVGMQMLANRSDEGVLNGLGWIDGEVRKFDPAQINQATQLPHMGWNDVQPKSDNGLFTELTTNSKFYFLHSYYFKAHRNQDILAVTNYGDEFSSAVNAGNIYGVQFHPEKSHHYGIRLLKNFANL
ncbi:imidazole glycerol phosphate synthase subunit HisH [Chitinophaga solisilvae]|uniref:imidazole glycerol phosphate synthase subunit HisH n=1 Tax=Chitinophaga solisilvae TaxID=1233460 RepID=UPI00137105FD|nr:imidazole glycerol phosphate synthase subunit HisH [Chitinophaga solisilvae]